MGVRHFQSDDGHTNSLAGNRSLHSPGNLLGKYMKACCRFIVQVKDVINLLLGHDEGMTHDQGGDVQESNEVFVLCHNVAGDLTVDDACENRCHNLSSLKFTDKLCQQCKVILKLC